MLEKRSTDFGSLVWYKFFVPKFQIFVSSHYTGDDIVPRVRNGEYWKKVFGPVFIYLNSASTKSDPKLLWEDAKKQVGRLASFPIENYYYCM